MRHIQGDSLGSNPGFLFFVRNFVRLVFSMYHYAFTLADATATNYTMESANSGNQMNSNSKQIKPGREKKQHKLKQIHEYIHQMREQRISMRYNRLFGCWFIAASNFSMEQTIFVGILTYQLCLYVPIIHRQSEHIMSYNSLDCVGSAFGWALFLLYISFYVLKCLPKQEYDQNIEKQQQQHHIEHHQEQSQLSQNFNF